MKKKLLCYSDSLSNTLKKFVRMSALIFLLPSLFLIPVYGQLELLKDINTQEELSSNEYSQLISANGDIYFIAGGNQLWRSDGTPDGTVLIKTIKFLKTMYMVNNTLYFVGDDGTHGTELWKSNGTEASTMMVKDIATGTSGSSPELFTNVNGILFFAANNGKNGKELWKSDGTVTGTVMVKDILQVSGSSNPSGLTNVNGTLYFSANDGANGYELWRSDGTAAGTVMVKDIRAGVKLSSSPEYLRNVNGTLFFAANDGITGKELWKSDGTAAGTSLVKDIRNGAETSDIENTINVNGVLMFTANDGIYGDELWKSDGTLEGTVLVKDMNPGGKGSNSSSYWGAPMGNFANINGILYFTASQNDREYIYRSDGSEGGTMIIAPSESTGIYDAKPHFTYLNGKVYFFNAVADGQPAPYYLLAMDYNGTTPVIVKALSAPEDFYEDYTTKMVAAGNLLFINAQLRGGYALIRSDGTSAGTLEIQDLQRPTWGTTITDMVHVNGQVFFLAFPHTDGWGSTDLYGYLYKTDGTPEGTVQFRESEVYGIGAVDSKLFFTQQVNGGWGLYVTQGMDETITQVATISSAESPTGFTNVNGILYFSTVEGQLWKSDGTSTGTVKVRDLNRILSITNVGGKAYILAETPEQHLDVWRTNPTGLLRVKTIRTAWAYPSRENPTTSIGNIFYFVANDGIHGSEVWRSDGTERGTYMMFDIRTNDVPADEPIEYDINSFSIFNNKLHFTAKDNTGTWALYRATGNTSYEKIKDLPGGAQAMINHNNKLYVFAKNSDYYTSYGLWISDGTATGTNQVSTFSGHGLLDYVIVDDIIYFNSIEGQSLWRTDGTECGTFTVDLGLGNPYPVEAIGTSLIIPGDRSLTGRELYAFHHITDIQSQCNEAVAFASAFAESKQATITPYPNPYTSEFSLQVHGSEGDLLEVVVLNAMGTTVEKFAALKANTVHDHIGANWPKGMYIVKVNKAGVVTNYTVVKK